MVITKAKLGKGKSVFRTLARLYSHGVRWQPPLKSPSLGRHSPSARLARFDRAVKVTGSSAAIADSVSMGGALDVGEIVFTACPGAQKLHPAGLDQPE